MVKAGLLSAFAVEGNCVVINCYYGLCLMGGGPGMASDDFNVLWLKRSAHAKGG